MEIGLNKGQLSRYIHLLHQTAELAENHNEKFTVENANNALRLWEYAASLRVAVSINYYITFNAPVIIPPN